MTPEMWSTFVLVPFNTNVLLVAYVSMSVSLTLTLHPFMIEVNEEEHEK